MKKIVLNELKKVLSEKEMKHVTGGSGSCTVSCNGTNYLIVCYSLEQCDDKAYALCGDGGWTTTCY